MFVSVICQRIDRNTCILLAENGRSEMRLKFKIPFWKSDKAIWTAIYKARIKFQKAGFEVSGAQISSALTSVYPEIPYVYY